MARKGCHFPMSLLDVEHEAQNSSRWHKRKQESEHVTDVYEMHVTQDPMRKHAWK